MSETQTRIVTTAFGRMIRLDIDRKLDDFNQFGVRLSVDGKVRHEAFYTDKTEEVPDD